MLARSALIVSVRPVAVAVAPYPLPVMSRALVCSSIAVASIVATVAAAVLTPSTPDRRPAMAALILAGGLAVPALALSQSRD
jgi:hypothetical protein